MPYSRKLLNRRRYYTPRWIVLLIDTVFSLFSAATAIITTGLGWFGLTIKDYILLSAVVISVRILSFLLFKTYSGIVRYTGVQDILRIFYTLTAGELVLLLFKAVIYFGSIKLTVPLFFLCLEYTTLLAIMIFSRLIFKVLFSNNFIKEKERRNIVIYGSEQYMIMLQQVLANASDVTYNIVGFVDSNNRIAGKHLSGIKVYKTKQLEELLCNEDIDSLIIAQKIMQAKRKSELVDACLKSGVAIKEVPNLEKLINGKFMANNIRNIKIEDLLDRGVIELDDSNVREQVAGKTIMVTGAAGSIGSEIVRQLTHFGPRTIILIDVAETPLYDLEIELTESLGFGDFNVELMSIRDREGIERVFQKYRPEIVYHAAAYKHVPIIERLPLEGVKTNILGTQKIADLAVKYSVSKFVMVSTDKAVNPTNVMGCTKRMAEIYIQSLNSVSETAFITTRFGNVLGSNGSVVPRFAKQIEGGGPVTVTHPDMTRFFMTIPEACQLVLQAGALGEGGEIFVFDMGESVKIADLARNMIRLSGYEVNKDIKIVYTGLRPGEKLYEEVLNNEEQILPTINEKINRARVREYDFEKVTEVFDCLKTMLAFQNEFNIIRLLKTVIPEYKSNNSIYQQIDEAIEKEAETNISLGGGGILPGEEQDSSAGLNREALS